LTLYTVIPSKGFADNSIGYATIDKTQYAGFTLKKVGKNLYVPKLLDKQHLTLPAATNGMGITVFEAGVKGNQVTASQVDITQTPPLFVSGTTSGWTGWVGMRIPPSSLYCCTG